MLSDGDLQLSHTAAAALAGFRDQPAVVSRLNEQARGGQSDGARIAAIEALGKMVDKSSAQTLGNLLDNRDEHEAVRTAAADALVAFTGLSENYRDPARWAAWWAISGRKNEADFRTDILLSRAARLDAMDARHRVLADQVTGELAEQFRSAPAAARVEMLMRMLNSSAPEIRVLGHRRSVDHGPGEAGSRRGDAATAPVDRGQRSAGSLRSRRCAQDAQ